MENMETLAASLIRNISDDESLLEFVEYVADRLKMLYNQAVDDCAKSAVTSLKYNGVDKESILKNKIL